jgi:hypothetical protein
MTRVNRAWLGFLLAPGVPAALLYCIGRIKGYGNGAMVGPVLLATPAYASALLLGLPIHLYLSKRHVKGFLSYVVIGASIGLFSVVAITLIQAMGGWNYTSDHAYSLSLWKYSGGYLRVASIYAAAASAAFWVIAVWQRRPPEQSVPDGR